METWALVLVIVCSCILGLLLFSVILGLIIIVRANRHNFLIKEFNKMQSNHCPEFDAQADKEWFFQDGYFRYISIPSYDKQEICSYIHKENSHLYIIFAHGYVGHPDEKAKCLHELENRYHCNIIVMEQRGQLNSKIKYCTMGYKEGHDVVSWTDYVKQLDPNAQIVVYGESLGGATVMFGLHYGYNDLVKCVIEEAGYTSIAKEYYFTGYCNVPKWLSAYGVLGTIISFFLFFRMRIIKHSPLKGVMKKTIPICFIHGDNDNIVPYECFEEFKKNINPETNAVFETFHGASHCGAYYLDNERYMTILFNFLDANINKNDLYF